MGLRGRATGVRPSRWLPGPGPRPPGPAPGAPPDPRGRSFAAGPFPGLSPGSVPGPSPLLGASSGVPGPLRGACDGLDGFGSPGLLHGSPQDPACLPAPTPLPFRGSCWGSSRPLLPSAAVPSMPGEYPLTPGSPFSPRVRLRSVTFTLSFPSAQPPPSSCRRQPLPTLQGHGAPRCPPRGPNLRGWEGLQLLGARQPPTQGSLVFDGPSCASAEGTRASGDAVAGLLVVNGLSILHAVAWLQAGSSYLEGRRHV